MITFSRNRSSSESGPIHESRTRNILSFNAERTISQKVKQLEDDIKGKEIQQGVKIEPRDIRVLEQKLRGMRETLKQGAASRLEGRERQQAEMEIKRLEEAMKKFWGGRFPSQEEHWITPKAGGIRYRNYVNKITQINSSKQYAELIRRWKHLRRRLEPSDPDISNTLHLMR